MPGPSLDIFVQVGFLIFLVENFIMRMRFCNEQLM
jgi:hypothetical protein